MARASSHHRNSQTWGFFGLSYKVLNEKGVMFLFPPLQGPRTSVFCFLHSCGCCSHCLTALFSVLLFGTLFLLFISSHFHTYDASYRYHKSQFGTITYFPKRNHRTDRKINCFMISQMQIYSATIKTKHNRVSIMRTTR